MADSTPNQFTVMTNAGLELVNQLVTTKNSIKSLRAVESDVNHYTDDPETVAGLTDIDSVKQAGIIRAVIDSGSANSIVQIDFDLSKLDAPYQLNSVGLYATDQNGKEILYAIECLQHPQYMDASTTMDVNSHYMKIAVGNVEQMDVSLSPAGMVSLAELKGILADYLPIKDFKADRLNETGFSIDTTGLAVNDYPRFVAFGYYNGAGIPQATAYAGVETMFGLHLAVDLKDNGQTVLTKFRLSEVAKYLPEFDTASFTQTVSSDGKWVYLVSGVATIGIQCLNAKFKN